MNPLRVLQAALAPTPHELREMLQESLGEDGYRELIDAALNRAKELYSLAEGRGLQVTMPQVFQSLLSRSRDSEAAIAAYVVARLEWEEAQDADESGAST